MRQAGFLAAAGIYALDNQVERLKEDHARARKLGECFRGLSIVSEVLPVATKHCDRSIGRNFSRGFHVKARRKRY